MLKELQSIWLNLDLLDAEELKARESEILDRYNQIAHYMNETKEEKNSPKTEEK